MSIESVKFFIKSNRGDVRLKKGYKKLEDRNTISKIARKISKMNLFGLILAFLQMPAAHTLNSIDQILNEVRYYSTVQVLRVFSR